MNKELPEHLGGHMNKVHTDRATLIHIKNKYNIKTMIDIGCGPGDMVEIANDRGIVAIGIDGDFTLPKKKEIIIHDFCSGPYDSDVSFDLGYSVEFLEHVEEKYQDNYMQLFKQCKYVVCTAAPPGYAGHHHVNCRDTEYWKEVFFKYDFLFNQEETDYIRANSVMHKPFMQTTGMFFERIL
jgi:cyclopropane fatty-acyl-phospholipid synthase-like methyltransferase